MSTASNKGFSVTSKPELQTVSVLMRRLVTSVSSGSILFAQVYGLVTGVRQRIITPLQVPLSILGKPIGGLVDYLVQEYDDNMSKVRVLYRWLTNQPITRMKILGKEPKEKGSALYHLWLLRNNRERYSTVFSYMCRYHSLFSGSPKLSIQKRVLRTYAGNKKKKKKQI